MTDELPETSASPRTPDEELLQAAARIATDPMRIGRMRHELEMGFARMADVERGVAVFGSARTPVDHPEYARAVEIARRLGESGFAIITGGGSGIMAAANQGARQAGALSIGLAIDLPFREPENPWTDRALRFHYFFTRKVMFVRYASAFVVFPGGFGTLDETFEALTLIQTHKVRSFPLILVGRDYWGPLVAWLHDHVAAGGKISESDLALIRVVDGADEVVALVAATCGRSPSGNGHPPAAGPSAAASSS